MKIKDLSFITEVTKENTNSINGGFDPIARADENLELFNSVLSGETSQGEMGLVLFEQSLNDMTDFYQSLGWA